MIRVRRRLAASMAACVAAGVIVAVASTTPAAAAPDCVNDQLQRAPVVTGDVRADGSPVVASKDRRGKQVPVVLVPGAGETGTVPSDSRTGPFAHPVDLVAGTAEVADTPRSLLGELQNLPGTDVFVFDYATWADAWVDDTHLGPALGSALACLRQATGERAIVVTQSTGSLIARWALTHPVPGVSDPTSLASTIVTFGSPDTGSTLGLLAPGGVAAAERAGLTQAAPVAGVLRLLAAQCAAAADGPADGSLCDHLDRTTPLATGDLGRALTVGSSQLGAWPAGVAVHDLHASVTLTLPEYGWFGSAGEPGPLAVGDLSDLTTARPDAAKPAVACALTLAPTADGSSWTVAATDSDDAGTAIATATSPCLASDLTRTVELVASAKAVVLADLFRRQPLVAKDLLSAPIPSLCDWWPAGQLTNGKYVGPNPDPAGYAQPPTLVTPESYRNGPFVALGDLDGDGIGDAAATVNCNKGGVGWPDYLLMWGSGLRLLGAYFMGDAVGEARSGTRSIAYADGAVVVDGLDARPWDAACCVSGLAKVTLKWDGKAVVAADVDHLQGPYDYTFAGIGDVEIGMSRSELEAVGAVASQYNGGGMCDRYTVSDQIEVTVDNGSDEVIRAQLPYGSTEAQRTYPEGVGVGSTLSEVYAAYSDHEIENHLDGSFGQGSDGILVEGDGNYLSFGTSDGVMVSDLAVSNYDDYGIREYCSG